MTGLDEKYIVEAYNGLNYQCVETGNKSKICYILFSSNGLYYPDTASNFQEQILEKDRYEWKWVVEHSQIPVLAEKIIYVRDLYKDWYSKGINSKVNTRDKLIELLKELTDGYKVITIGSSAGGYMAVLSAIKLNAAWCINFSGQYTIDTETDKTYQDISELLGEYRGKIFYCVPAFSEQDIMQYKRVERIDSVKTLLFLSKKHADTMFAGNMCCIIDKQEEDLITLWNKYNNKIVGKISFLLRTAPVRTIIKILKREVCGFIIRKTGKCNNGI